ncbi:hypothetical protein ID866_10520 [Astraeus odoratus]|nr:hypothetical protein ID866_10520 [Astraeus odoratus]
MLSSTAAPFFTLFEMLSLLFLHSHEWFVRFVYGMRQSFLLASSLKASRSLLLYTASTIH